MTDPRRFARISELFDELVELDPASREARLETLDLAPTEIRELRTLLDADARAQGFVASARAARDALLDLGDPACGQRMGAWTVDGVLGRGGMGVVLRAHRVEGGFSQRGAIKCLHAELTGPGVAARFLREREVLARLEHPNIARLIDGGLDEQGRPFLVMELVEGSTLLAWCAEQRADLDMRLARFREVASAVAHAHAQLIVHCDIKPANVMVDADGRARLLDFGIARLLREGPMDAATLTRGAPFTPAYAAPEQLRGEPVSTATDVYALGALLYELASGQRPYALDPARPESWAAALQGPTCAPPSAAAGAGDGPAPVPLRRLRGDFDTLVLKALQRDPQRRYASVDALLLDLDRWRSGLPISARRDSLAYRSTRFVARHRVASLVACLAVLMVLGALVLALQQAASARAEAARAEAAQRFLGSLFDTTDPLQTGDLPARNAREILDAGAARLSSEFADQPALQADLAQQLGVLYRQFGDFAASRRLLESALHLRESLDQPPLGRAIVLAHLSYAAVELSDFQASRDWRAQSRALFAQAGVDAHPQLAGTFGDEAWDEANAGHPEAAEAASLRAIEIARRVPGNDAQLRELLGDLGSVYFDRGDLPKAHAISTQQYAVARASLGDAHPETLRILRHLGVESIAMRDFRSAEAQLRTARDGLAGRLPAGHNYVLDASGDLAALYINTGRYREAAALIEPVRVARCARSGESSMECASFRLREAWLRVVRGQREEGSTQMQAALETARAVGGGEHAFFLVGELRLASVLADRGETGAALERASRARAGLVEAMRADAPERAFADEVLGYASAIDGRFDAGLELLRAAAEQRASNPASSAMERARGLLWLAEAESWAGQAEAARATLTAALAVQLDDFPIDEDLAAERDLLRGALDAARDPGCMATEAAAGHAAARFGQQDLRTADALIFLARCRRAQGIAAPGTDGPRVTVEAGHGPRHPRTRAARELRA